MSIAYNETPVNWLDQTLYQYATQMDSLDMQSQAYKQTDSKVPNSSQRSSPVWENRSLSVELKRNVLGQEQRQ